MLSGGSLVAEFNGWRRRTGIEPGLRRCQTRERLLFNEDLGGFAFGNGGHDSVIHRGDPVVG